MEATGSDDLLAAARLALDQDRKRQVGILAQLQAKFLYCRAVADQRRGAVPAHFIERAKGQGALQDLLQIARVAGLGDEFGSAERARVASITVVALPREDDDADVRRKLQQIRDQRKAFIGTMWQRRQSEVDEGQFRESAQLSQHLQAMWTRMTGDNLEERTHREAQGVTDQRIVVNDEEKWLVAQDGVRFAGHEGRGVARECACAALFHTCIGAKRFTSTTVDSRV